MSQVEVGDGRLSRTQVMRPCMMVRKFMIPEDQVKGDDKIAYVLGIRHVHAKKLLQVQKEKEDRERKEAAEGRLPKTPRSPLRPLRQKSPKLPRMEEEGESGEPGVSRVDMSWLGRLGISR